MIYYNPNKNYVAKIEELIIENAEDKNRLEILEQFLILEKRKMEVSEQYKKLPFLTSHHNKAILILEYNEILRKLPKLTEQLEHLNIILYQWSL